MFLAKSNLFGVAKNCKGDMVYMIWFATTHILAVGVSMIFAISCFGKRILDWCRRWIWQLKCHSKPLHVFWGLNEKSVILAKDIYRDSKDHIVFVDFPSATDENKDGRYRRRA